MQSGILASVRYKRQPNVVRCAFSLGRSLTFASAERNVCRTLLIRGSGLFGLLSLRMGAYESLWSTFVVLWMTLTSVSSRMEDGGKT